MSLSQRQRDAAFKNLATSYEPSYQHAKAAALLSRVYGSLRPSIGYVRGPTPLQCTLTEIQTAADKVVDDWRATPEHSGVAYFAKVGVIIAIVDSAPPLKQQDAIAIVPNDALQAMLEGRAPIQLFHPSGDVLESMWRAEHGYDLP